jgi:anti-anti-sigma factor
MCNEIDLAGVIVTARAGIQGGGDAERIRMQIETDGPKLVLSGAFDVRSTGQVRQAIYDHLDRDEDLVVDLTDVDSIDLTALKVLAVATHRAACLGHRLVLRGCGPAVRRLLHLSRLIRVVEVEREAATA